MWEYLTRLYDKSNFSLLQYKLNECGKDGWELVSLIDCERSLYKATFKRKKDELDKKNI